MTVTHANGCQGNTQYTAFYDNLWRHERCHAVRAKAQFEAGIDPRTVAEQIVRKDSLLTIEDVVFTTNGLNDVSGQVNKYSKVIDTLQGSTYPIWMFAPSTNTWGITNLPVTDAITTGC